MIVDGAAALAVEIEIAVVGDIEDGRLVRRGLIIDPQGVAVRERIRDFDLEIAGKAHLAIGGEIIELDRSIAQLLAGPDARVETFRAAVQRVGTVVGGKRIFLAIELEMPFGNAVAVPA